MKGTYLLLWKHLLARSHEFRSQFLFKAASQFNGIQEIVTNEDFLGVHGTSKVMSVHRKELLSFQGLGVCLLEYLVD